MHSRPPVMDGHRTNTQTQNSMPLPQVGIETSGSAVFQLSAEDKVWKEAGLVKIQTTKQEVVM